MIGNQISIPKTESWDKFPPQIYSSYFSKLGGGLEIMAAVYDPSKKKEAIPILNRPVWPQWILSPTEKTE